MLSDRPCQTKQQAKPEWHRKGRDPSTRKVHSLLVPVLTWHGSGPCVPGAMAHPREINPHRGGLAYSLL
ncbi:hypothetical protein GCM10010309_55960 [Streptomyces violaceochromogenes]|nr:hypothetical protein GCM10010309_55960 [Streptomyces violaceochromogenes]